MAELPFTKLGRLAVASAPGGLLVGEQFMPLGAALDYGAPIGSVAVDAIRRAAQQHERLCGACHAQLAALVFDVTSEPRALDWYFPTLRGMGEDAIEPFYALVLEIVRSPNFDLRLIGMAGRDLTESMPMDSMAIVAGQIAELFFLRRDILARLLAGPRHFWLYTTPRAYQQAGGVAGGCYHANHGCVQLVLSRLYEGFGGPQPGVAPLLHEFGHMLDFFDAASARQGDSAGLLPGLDPRDGPIYTPAARQLFLAGKRLEAERYLRRYHGTSAPDDPLPIGHPYVFQNDTEFIAGYTEMFLRNPNYFAAQNPQLYGGYVALFGFDPRRAWPQDFPFYVEENRRFYLASGERPWPCGLTVG